MPAPRVGLINGLLGLGEGTRIVCQKWDGSETYYSLEVGPTLNGNGTQGLLYQATFDTQTHQNQEFRKRVCTAGGKCPKMNAMSSACGECKFSKIYVATEPCYSVDTNRADSGKAETVLIENAVAKHFNHRHEFEQELDAFQRWQKSLVYDGMHVVRMLAYDQRRKILILELLTGSDLYPGKRFDDVLCTKEHFQLRPEKGLANPHLGGRQATEILYGTAKGLRALHRAGLQHRDLKGANIMLNCENGTVKLVDLGMALRPAGHTVGNVNHMFPLLDLLQGRVGTMATKRRIAPTPSRTAHKQKACKWKPDLPIIGCEEAFGVVLTETLCLVDIYSFGVLVQDFLLLEQLENDDEFLKKETAFLGWYREALDQSTAPDAGDENEPANDCLRTALLEMHRGHINRNQNYKWAKNSLRWRDFPAVAQYINDAIVYPCLQFEKVLEDAQMDPSSISRMFEDIISKLEFILRFPDWSLVTLNEAGHLVSDERKGRRLHHHYRMTGLGHEFRLTDQQPHVVCDFDEHHPLFGG